ncbi:MAG: hypothetical protein ABI720_13440, partial [Actinomycetes bacterium]
LQSHLDAQPTDARGWAILSLLLIEQGRASADPSAYARADDASETSLSVQTRGNDLALAARAALYSAYHRFDEALQMANQSLAINPYGPAALGVRVDALTELGRFPAAQRAAVVFDTRQPGLAATTRLAYQAELRADDDQARRLFAAALAQATDPASIAFTEFHLGELARRAGQLNAAQGHYDAALTAVADDPTALAGRARVLALQGKLQRATAILEGVVQRVPSIEHLVALGELHEVQGDDAAAQQQYDVVRAAADLSRSAGVRPDLELAWFEADHGSARAALDLARAEWRARKSPLVADALAWALHANGDDAEALRYTRLATAYGGDARSWHHRGVIEAALGQDEAVRHLRYAVKVDRGYATWQAEQVQIALADLEGQR